MKKVIFVLMFILYSSSAYGDSALMPITIYNSNITTNFVYQQTSEIKLQWNNIRSNNYIGSIFNSSGTNMRIIDVSINSNVPFWRKSFNVSTKISSIIINTTLYTNSNKTFYIYGSTDNTDISSYSATMTKISPNASCVALWHMDEGTGDTLIDSTGNGNNAVSQTSAYTKWKATDGGKCGSTSVVFSNGSALDFTNSEAYSVYCQNSAMDWVSNFSVEGWFYPSGSGGEVLMAIGVGNGVFKALLAFGMTGALLFETRMAVGTQDYSRATMVAPPTLQWIHVVGTHSGNTISLYVNGVLIDDNYDASVSPIIGVGKGITHLAYSKTTFNNTTQYFTGFMDEVAVYAYALSIEEIQAHYNRSKYTLKKPGHRVGTTRKTKLFVE